LVELPRIVGGVVLGNAGTLLGGGFDVLRTSRQTGGEERQSNQMAQPHGTLSLVSAFGPGAAGASRAKLPVSQQSAGIMISAKSSSNERAGPSIGVYAQAKRTISKTRTSLRDSPGVAMAGRTPPTQILVPVFPNFVHHLSIHRPRISKSHGHRQTH
jgi:hypothetical protein